MINRKNDSMNLMLIVVLGIILLISLLSVKPIISNTSLTINNIGLPEDAVNELRKLLGH